MKKSIILLSTAFLFFPSISFATDLEVDNYDKASENDIVYYDYNKPSDIEDYDDSILLNSSYKFYNDDESTNIEVDNYDDSQIYINNKRVNSSKELQDNLKDGENYIDLLDTTEKTNVNIETTEKEVPINSDVENLDKDTTDLLEKLLDEEVKQNFAGGQVSVIKNNKEIYNHSFGYKNNFYQDGNPIELEKREAVDDQTMFDLASNTKMYVTNYSLQKLAYERKINLDDKVSKYISDFKDSPSDKIKGKDTLTIRDLLMHQAGFPADPQYHNQNYDKDDGIVNGKNDLYSQSRDETLKQILKTPLKYEPGSDTIYSDVDYMLLGFIVENVSGMRLDEYFDENFVKPLNLKRTTFNPLKNGFSKNDTAATELNGNTRDGIVKFNNIRTDTIQGEVHDEKAYYSMDGISGHAGLFSNARELSLLANIMLNDGKYNDIVFWDKSTQELFTKAKESDPSYGLGWRLFGDGKYAWAFSNLASKKTFGHTGWTGTLTVIDPVENMVITLLTNKKNSPVLDPKENPNKFYSDQSLSAGYGFVTTMIYKSLMESTPEEIIALAKETANGKKRLIKEKDSYFNVGQINDYIAAKNTYEYVNEIYKDRIEVRKLIKEFDKISNLEDISSKKDCKDSQRVTSVLYSPNLKLDWNYSIYLPENYDSNKEGGYPVLYMLHGLGGNHTNLLERFDSKSILDKIIKDTKIPMIVVFPDGFNSFYINQNDGMQMETAIMKDLIPHIDKAYNTKKDRKSRSIGGISMGAYGASRLALKYPDMFSKVTLISPALWYELSEDNSIKKNYNAFRKADDSWSDNFYKSMHPSKLIKDNMDIKFYIRSSSGDTTVAIDDVNSFYEDLKSHNISTILKEDSKENEHNWDYWRSIAYDFYKWTNEEFK